jgi:hypothetical protein
LEPEAEEIAIVRHFNGTAFGLPRAHIWWKTMSMQILFWLPSLQASCVALHGGLGRNSPIAEVVRLIIRLLQSQ